MRPWRSALPYMRWFVQDWDKKSDGELVALAQAGERGATEALLDRYKDAVRRCARRFAFRTAAETDDLVQEGMIGLYSAVGSYQPAGGKSFKNFVYLCVQRRIISYLRAISRRALGENVADFDPEEISVETANPEELLIGSEADEELKIRLVKELSDFEFRVVALYLEGMSYARISEETGKDVKSIDNALSRAKRKLQKVFS